ncbi:glutamate receptor ionotropic, kainate 4-like [Lepeophtheirus salmonis]|uniref:glutamate receptor ionotropic, kainate 4-like n=1 Tax=Lepeophtheirus salmonis TaxID=72036 RepID=UPI003AF3C5F3
MPKNFVLKTLMALLLINKIHINSFDLNISMTSEWLQTHLQNQGINHVIVVLDFQDQEKSYSFNELCFFLNQQGVSIVVTYIMFPSESLSQILSKNNDIRYLVIVEFSRIFSIIMKYLDSMYFIRNNWLFFAETTDFWNEFENMKGLRQNSRLYFYVSGKGIFEIYRPHSNTSIIYNILYDSNLQRISFNHIHDRRKNLHGLKLRVAYCLSLRSSSFNTNGDWYYAIIAMSKHLNFTIEFIKLDDPIFGSLVDNSTFNGVVGAIQRDEADLSPMYFTISESRSKVVDFSIETKVSRINLYTKVKNNHIWKWNSLLNVFDISFWYYLTVTLALFYLTLMLILKVCETKKCKEKAISFLDVIFIVYFCVLGKDSIVPDPKRCSKRTLYFTMSLFGAIVSWSYNANLISLLTTSNHEIPIKNLKDILVYKEYKLLIIKGTSIADEFRTAQKETNRLHYDIYQNIIKDNEHEVFPSLNVAKERSLNEDNILILNYDYHFDWDLRFKKIDCGFGADHMGWIYNKNFEYAELFNHHIILMKEFGIQNRIYKRFEKNYEKSHSSEKLYYELGFQNVFAVFFILNLGVGISFFVFIMEFFYSFYQKRRSHSIIIMELRK